MKLNGRAHRIIMATAHPFVCDQWPGLWAHCSTDPDTQIGVMCLWLQQPGCSIHLRYTREFPFYFMLYFVVVVFVFAHLHFDNPAKTLYSRDMWVL